MREQASTAFGRVARLPVRERTAPTGWPQTRCWKRWCSARARRRILMIFFPICGHRQQTCPHFPDTRNRQWMAVRSRRLFASARDHVRLCRRRQKRGGIGLREALPELFTVAVAKRRTALSAKSCADRAVHRTVAALQREESRGAQFRSDFPEPRDNWKRRSYLTLC